MIHDAWYVVALPEEIDEGLLSRRIVDIPVVVYRQADGRAAAMLDICPHRFAALSDGVLKDGNVQCPYHGLEFDGDGRCVHNPHGQGTRTSALNVRTFPLVERDSLVWIWPGRPELANPADIPDFSCRTDPGRRTVGGVGHVDCNYRLLIDNLMDLGHAQYVHPSASQSDAFNRAVRKVVVGANAIEALLKIPDGTPDAGMAKFLAGYNGPVDVRWDIRWSKVSAMLNFIAIAPPGAASDDSVNTLGTHIITPETETSCHYFYGASRNFGQEDVAIDDAVRAWQLQALNKEDKGIVEAIQGRRDYVERHGLRPAMLSCDEAAVRVAREIDRLENVAAVGAEA